MQSFTLKQTSNPDTTTSNLQARDNQYRPAAETDKLRKSHRIYRPLAYSIIAVAIICAGFLVVMHTLHHSSQLSDPVPLAIRQRVSFKVYFPEPANLPPGYTLDTRSFAIVSNVILYTVTSNNNQHLFFSVQPKPSASALQNFYKSHMPLTISVSTSVGTAAIGVLNNETVGSLPTNTDAWVIVTAPLNMNQNQFKRILQSMTLAQ